MALNFSPCQTFPCAYPSAADGCDFFSSIWDRGTDGHGKGCDCLDWLKGAFPSDDYTGDSGGGRVNNARTSIPSNAGGGGGYTDIADLLPSDPFEMELGPTLTAAITEWMGGHLGVDQQGGGDFFGAVNCSNGLMDGFDSFRNGSGGARPMTIPKFSAKAEVKYFSGKVHPDPDCYKPSLDMSTSSSPAAAAATCTRDANLSAGWDEEGDEEEWLCYSQPDNQDRTSECDASQSGYQVSSPGTTMTEANQSNKASYASDHVAWDFPGEDISGRSGGEVCPEDDRALVTRETAQPPHDGLLFTISYSGCLGVRDLLSVERVCKMTRSAVRDDPSPWRCIHVSRPLNDRLTDDALLSLVKRAAGHLQCLSLVECSKITDEGLKRVFEANPRLTKLSVPGCRLSVEVLIDCMKMLKARGMPGIKYLRISGLYGVTQTHYEDLMSLLGMDQHQRPKPLRPQLYPCDPISSCDYDLPLDIEICPRCQNLRLVYDCPAESCQGKDSEPCRACGICIARCFKCGKCINDSEYEETFHLDYVCSDCVKILITSEDPQHKESSYYNLIPVLPLETRSTSAGITVANCI